MDRSNNFPFFSSPTTLTCRSPTCFHRIRGLEERPEDICHRKLKFKQDSKLRDWWFYYPFFTTVSCRRSPFFYVYNLTFSCKDEGKTQLHPSPMFPHRVGKCMGEEPSDSLEFWDELIRRTWYALFTYSSVQWRFYKKEAPEKQPRLELWAEERDNQTVLEAHRKSMIFLVLLRRFARGGSDLLSTSEV